MRGISLKNDKQSRMPVVFMALNLVVPTTLAAEEFGRDYLVGDWCYQQQIYPSNPPETMNVNYRFSANGEFQTGLESERRSYKGTYEIFDDNRLKLSQIPIKLKVTAVTREGFHLELPTKQSMIFGRGLCDR